VVSKIVEEAYRNVLMTGKFPFFVLNIQLSPSLVDVNVHPAKTEIKFANEKDIYDIVYHGVKNAIYRRPEIPIKETTSQCPINPYGESKLCFEKVLKWYSACYGLKYVALRYFNAAGATEKFGEDHNPESHLIPILLQVAQGKREKAMLFGDDYDTPDGTCIRDYIHILDLAQAHEKALYAPQSGHYNLGTGSGYSVKQILDAARKVTGHPIPADVVPRRPGDPPRLIACSDKARTELGWKPQFEDPEIIIESAWKWRLAHPDGYEK
jgi:UDP-glucose 4-epimerase